MAERKLSVPKMSTVGRAVLWLPPYNPADKYERFHTESECSPEEMISRRILNARRVRQTLYVSCLARQEKLYVLQLALWSSTLYWALLFSCDRP